jgi:hypothetical protein
MQKRQAKRGYGRFLSFILTVAFLILFGILSELIISGDLFSIFFHVLISIHFNNIFDFPINMIVNIVNQREMISSMADFSAGNIFCLALLLGTFLLFKKPARSMTVIAICLLWLFLFVITGYITFILYLVRILLGFISLQPAIYGIPVAGFFFKSFFAQNLFTLLAGLFFYYQLVKLIKTVMYASMIGVTDLTKTPARRDFIN